MHNRTNSTARQIGITGAEKRTVFKGTINYSIVYPVEIFADALTGRAAGIIYVHNQPEDDVEPKEQDKKITKQLMETGKLPGMEVVDDIVEIKNAYFSFRENGMI